MNQCITDSNTVITDSATRTTAFKIADMPNVGYELLRKDNQTAEEKVKVQQ